MGKPWQKLKWDVALDDADMTIGDMDETLTSDWVAVDGKPFSIQLAWTDDDTPEGAFSFQTSNDGSTADDVDSTLFDPAAEHPAGTAGSHTFNFSTLRVSRVRVKYTPTGATGTGAGLTGTVRVG